VDRARATLLPSLLMNFILSFACAWLAGLGDSAAVWAVAVWQPQWLSINSLREIYINIFSYLEYIK
jgi:hypothetical protein